MTRVILLCMKEAWFIHARMPSRPEGSRTKWIRSLRKDDTITIAQKTETTSVFRCPSGRPGIPYLADIQGQTSKRRPGTLIA